MVALSMPPSEAIERLEVNKLVDEATDEKNEVEVAFDVVAFTPVKFWSEVLPNTVSPPFALSAPPTLRSEESVVDEVTAKVPVEVAPVVVRLASVERPVTPSVEESVALVSVTRPLAVSAVKVAPLVALNCPPMVVEAFTANVPVLVAPVKSALLK